MNKHMKNENPTYYGSKVVTMIKVVEMQVKGHGQEDKVKQFGTDGNIYIYIFNIKYIAPFSCETRLKALYIGASSTSADTA